MQFPMNRIVEKRRPHPGNILLRFNRSDSQIARNWRESSHTKDMFDDQN